MPHFFVLAFVIIDQYVLRLPPFLAIGLASAEEIFEENEVVNNGKVESEKRAVIAYSDTINVLYPTSCLQSVICLRLLAFLTSMITRRTESGVLPDSFRTDFSKCLEYPTFIRPASSQTLLVRSQTTATYP